MIGFLVEIAIREGCEKKFEEAIKAQSRKVATEPGFSYCKLFATDTPGQYRMVEIYEDKQGLRAHVDFPHSKEFFEITKDLIAEEPVGTRIHQIDAVDGMKSGISN